MDWVYMLLERFVIQGIRASRDRSYQEPERLEVVCSALESGSDVRMVYFSASSRQFTERTVTPLRLTQARAGHWVMLGFDHLRGEERSFRVGRMKEVEPAEPSLSSFGSPGRSKRGIYAFDSIYRTLHTGGGGWPGRSRSRVSSMSGGTALTTERENPLTQPF